MKKTLWALIALALCGLWGCSDADSLGDEPPREVVVNGSPTWENGMRDLIQLKCGYCHAFPLTDISPDNIVTDLDLNVFDTRVENGQVIRGADAIGRWIFEGVLDQPVEPFLDIPLARQMPLDYGTPLTQQEKDTFRQWSNTGSPRNGDPQPQGNIEAGANLYSGVGFCDSCHLQGQGLLIAGQWVGPPIRPETATVEKIKSMWLYKITPDNPEPITTQQAADIRAYLLDQLGQ